MLKIEKAIRDGTGTFQQKLIYERLKNKQEYKLREKAFISAREKQFKRQYPKKSLPNDNRDM